ncbi:hypothetical protein SLEP1_g29834 [Rubroshorea leprosula]|uniref:non-specific serine/threonine protein kinase n=2 Tax=Rubroshorea leprosula TaxID=152421 RepID=A0AAV5JY69_9ROSI|nr:hypothetical protein SLEP1_g29834 [Rubroshorea leprosula]
MNVDTSLESVTSGFVEIDPTGRYGRYNEILGKGASKTVYKAFDEYEGIEVAWNQVKLHDFLQSPEVLERLYCEIHLLKTLKHENIMKFYTSWVDTANRNINFVTEMFISGTLKQYRLKHRRVNIRAVKHWCRQILRGLHYLHTRDPPVIHRDLKCDNIFVNGNQGEVKIGDLGLAAILRKSHAAHCVGTPEFMAPEVYEEEYNELVDIYSFGMCILEMVTFEYPYSECTHAVQIYKKVITGKKPDALYKVKDPEVREFVEKCLATVSLRLSAWELLKDPFLQVDDYGTDLREIEFQSDYAVAAPLIRQPVYDFHHNNSSSLINGYTNHPGYDLENEIDYDKLDLFTSQDDEHLGDVDIAIKGSRREDDDIFLRLRISDKEGRIRNIYFPFDIKTDTALSVATEMVSELDITDQDVTTIADMIDGEIATLVPEWKRELIMDENSHWSGANFCQNCAANGYLSDYVSSSSAGAKNLQVLQCSNQVCAAVHGRFEEITYQVEGTEEYDTEGGEAALSRSDSIHYADIWAQREGPEISSRDSRDIRCDDQAHKKSPQSIHGKEENIINMDSQSKPKATRSFSVNHVPDPDFSNDYENEIRQELRWLKAKYQMQLREFRGQQFGVSSRLTPSSNDSEHSKAAPYSILPLPKGESKRIVLKSLHLGSKLRGPHLSTNVEKKNSNFANQGIQNSEDSNDSSFGCSPEAMVTANSRTLLPHPLLRTSSLPVDALDV